jgi:hypothetical protein
MLVVFQKMCEEYVSSVVSETIEAESVLLMNRIVVSVERREITWRSTIHTLLDQVVMGANFQKDRIVVNKLKER